MEMEVEVEPQEDSDEISAGYLEFVRTTEEHRRQRILDDKFFVLIIHFILGDELRQKLAQKASNSKDSRYKFKGSSYKFELPDEDIYVLASDGMICLVFILIYTICTLI